MLLQGRQGGSVEGHAGSNAAHGGGQISQRRFAAACGGSWPSDKAAERQERGQAVGTAQQVTKRGHTRENGIGRGQAVHQPRSRSGRTSRVIGGSRRCRRTSRLVFLEKALEVQGRFKQIVRRLGGGRIRIHGSRGGHAKLLLKGGGGWIIRGGSLLLLQLVEGGRSGSQTAKPSVGSGGRIPSGLRRQACRELSLELFQVGTTARSTGLGGITGGGFLGERKTVGRIIQSSTELQV
mmetsp:Transcript_2077/g.4359  ORF Transcript_2077/g.4359 Transcript_2077/m.4359 type:complete len:237 (+) Transcript_2077:292-1002(+)